MTTQLDVWRQSTVDVDPGAEAGAERDDHLEPLAGNHGEALHVRVVGEAHRLAEHLAQGRFQLEARPALVAEIGGGQHVAVLDHPRESNGDAIVVPERSHELGESLDEGPRGASDRRVHADRLREEVTAVVDHGGLEVRAADVDRQRAKAPDRADLGWLCFGHGAPLRGLSPGKDLHGTTPDPRPAGGYSWARALRILGFRNQMSRAPPDGP